MATARAAADDDARTDGRHHLRRGRHPVWILLATIEHGADVDSTNCYGGTALIPAGADPELPDGDGASPRRLAAARGSSDIVDVIDAYR